MAEEKAERTVGRRVSEKHRSHPAAHFCAVVSYGTRVLECAFSELPARPPGYASEYCLMIQTLTPNGVVEVLHIWEGIPPDKR